jgi:hypothetical protein
VIPQARPSRRLTVCVFHSGLNLSSAVLSLGRQGGARLPGDEGGGAGAQVYDALPWQGHCAWRLLLCGRYGEGIIGVGDCVIIMIMIMIIVVVVIVVVVVIITIIMILTILITITITFLFIEPSPRLLDPPTAPLPEVTPPSTQRTLTQPSQTQTPAPCCPPQARRCFVSR